MRAELRVIDRTRRNDGIRRLCPIGWTARDQKLRGARWHGPHDDSRIRAQGAGGDDGAIDSPPQVVRLTRGQRREIVTPQHCLPVCEHDELHGAAFSGQLSISTALAGLLEDAEDVLRARQPLADVLGLASFADDERSRGCDGDSQPSQTDRFESDAPPTVDRTARRCRDPSERPQTVRDVAERGALGMTRRAFIQVGSDDPSLALIDSADGVDAEELAQIVVLVRIHSRLTTTPSAQREPASFRRSKAFFAGGHPSERIAA